MGEDMTYQPVMDWQKRAQELERENEVLRMIIDVIDTRTPVADETCDEPGICVSEAARRVLADEGKIVYDYAKKVQP